MNVTKLKTKPKRWTEDEQARVDAYRAACATLTDAIVEHSGDYLLHRAGMMATSANRAPLPAAAIAVLQAEGSALGVTLADGLAFVPWLAISHYMKVHGYPADEPPPEAIAPLALLVEHALAPLRTSYGLVLHPSASPEWGAIAHNPLSSETWPAGSRERRCVVRRYQGLPDWRAMEIVFVQHPIHAAFRAVSAAAQRIENVDLSKEPR